MNIVELKELETPRLVLRKLRFEDLYDCYERLMSDGEVTKYLNIEPHQDIGETLAELEQTLARYEEGSCYRWAIAGREDDRFLGIFELLPGEDDCTFNCMLAEDAWGRGYAAEAMEAAFRFAAEDLGVKRITADHMAPNTAAGAAMGKAGMVQVGVIPGKYEKQGRRFDAVCYERNAGPVEPLTADEYQKQAMRSLNPALGKRDVLINGVMGLCGESGECIDLVKKHLHQGHELDREKLAKELGDVAWYLAETAFALDLSLEEVLRGNLDKLKKRYPQGFDTRKSINR